MAKIWVVYGRWAYGRKGSVGYPHLKALKAGYNNFRWEYICRYVVDTRYEVGRLDIVDGKCYVGYSGWTYSSDEYQVLVNPREELFTWKSASNGNYPPGALITGFHLGIPTFSCRVKIIQGDDLMYILGELDVNNGCYLAWEGKDKLYTDYMVLAREKNKCTFGWSG